MVSNTRCQSNSGGRSAVHPVYSRLNEQIRVGLPISPVFAFFEEIEHFGQTYTLNTSLIVLRYCHDYQELMKCGNFLENYI